MKLDISEVFSLENGEIVKKVNMDMAVFQSKMGEFPIQKSKPFDIKIANLENKRLLIQGETDVTIAIPCDRCLEDVLTPFHITFEKELPIQVVAAASDNTEEDESDVYMEGFYLDVDRLIYGEILVNWPAKVLCRQDCKGICAKCGTNLNTGTCNCEQGELDPRMAAFQDVFNKFKEV